MGAVSRRQAIAILGGLPLAFGGGAIARESGQIGAIDAWSMGVRPDVKDVTGALQKALDTAAAEGRDVFVRATRKRQPYRLRGTLRLPPHTSLRSVAPEAAEFRCFARTALEITGSRCTVYGIRFVAVGAVRAQTAFRLATSQGGKIELINIKGCGARRFAFGIRDDKSTKFRMDTLHFERNSFQAMAGGGVGIMLRHIAGSIYVRDNMVSFLRSAKTGMGYYFLKGGGVKFSSHAIGNFDEGAGAANVGARFDRCSALWLEGCNIENFGGAGIQLDNCYVVRGWGIHAGACNGDAISVKNCIAVDLKTTTIRGNAASPGALPRAVGLRIAGESSEIRIDGLRINETTGDAVHLEASARDIDISGLMISGRRSKVGIGGHGLFSEADGVHLRGGFIRNVRGTGLIAGGRFDGRQLSINDCKRGLVRLLTPQARIWQWIGGRGQKRDPRNLAGPIDIP